MEHLSSRVSAVCEPGKEVSIDEVMIPFKGRSSLKQYMPLKPVRRGIKVWVWADASNGYVSSFQVYTGKEGNSTEHGLGAKVVKSLTANLSGSYRHVYFDNYFSSVDLLLDLQRSGLYGSGTLRLNRKGFPPQLKQPAKKGFKESGESKICQMKNLCQCGKTRYCHFDKLRPHTNEKCHSKAQRWNIPYISVPSCHCRL